MIGESHRENAMLSVEKLSILPPCSPVTVFLSDLHGARFGEGQRRLCDLIAKENPELILIGGDMITTKAYIPLDFEPLRELLSGIRRLYPDIPILYALGNHESRLYETDSYEASDRQAFEGLLQDFGLTLLVSGIRHFGPLSIVVPKIPLSLYHKGPYCKTEYQAVRQSLSDLYTGLKKEDRALFNEHYTIGLIHHPKLAYAGLTEGLSCALSGHYHGGMIRLFGMGLVSPDIFPFPRHTRGLYQTNAGTLIVSGGLGSHTFPIRVNNKPHILVLTAKDTGR